MNDPYQVLGVPRTASDDEVRSAYRELARKYHPDNYAGHPLADLAAEKMKEINEAYDSVQSQRRGGKRTTGGAYTSSRPSGGYSSHTASGSASRFSDVRRLINERRVSEASEILAGVPEGSRDAEWYFLKGHLLALRGWSEDAYNHFRRAAEMEPANTEYRTVLTQYNYRRQTGFPAGGFEATYCPSGERMSTGSPLCNLCTALWCADCCCRSVRCC